MSTFQSSSPDANRCDKSAKKPEMFTCELKSRLVVGNVCGMHDE